MKHFLLSSVVYISIALPFLSCTRAATSSGLAIVQMSLPTAATFGAKIAERQASLSAEGQVDVFSALTASQLCYFVNVTASDIAGATDSSCSTDHAIVGGSGASGATITFGVPAGSNRTFKMYAFQPAQTTDACPNLSSGTMSLSNESVYLVGTATASVAAPSTTVTMTVSLPDSTTSVAVQNAQEFSTCASWKQIGGGLNFAQNQQVVFTGQSLLVWGGDNPGSQTGQRINVMNGTSTPMSIAFNSSGQPILPRGLAASIWTGSQFLIWGGESNSENTIYADGYAYTSATDSWLPMGSSGAPTQRYLPAFANIGGNQMFVYGGTNFDGTSLVARSDGAIYSADSKGWTSLPTSGAPTDPRMNTTAVYIPNVPTDGGSAVVIWGGTDASNNPTDTKTYFLRNAGLSGTSWQTLSATGALTGRGQHAMVWTGSKLIVWGGEITGSAVNTGAMLDLSSGISTATWTAMSTSGAPSARAFPNAVWDGRRMIVWGGSGTLSGGGTNSGAAFDPASGINGTWTSLPSASFAPATLTTPFTAFWTAMGFLIYGGSEMGGAAVLH